MPAGGNHPLSPCLHCRDDPRRSPDEGETLIDLSSDAKFFTQ
jgi:hypothetical protein